MHACAPQGYIEQLIMPVYITPYGESRSLCKHPRLDKTDNSAIQLADVNEYAISVTNPQHVAVKESLREKLPPGLTIKSSHIRIGESIGQGTIIRDNVFEE